MQVQAILSMGATLPCRLERRNALLVRREARVPLLLQRVYVPQALIHRHRQPLVLHVLWDHTRMLGPVMARVGI